MISIRQMRAALAILVLLGAACDGGVTDSGRSAAGAITVSPSTPQTEVGRTVQLAAVITDSEGNPLPGRPVFWASADSSIASVSATGLVRGRAPGTTRIAASADGISELVTIVVSSRAVASVTIEPASITLASLADTVRFTATARDETGGAIPGKQVTWTSSADGVAAISSAGVATAVNNGVTSIAASVDGVTGAATLSVSQRVARVAVSPPSVALPVGDTVRFRASPLDANGYAVPNAAVTWGSSSAIVAPVDASGLVTGASTGEATITAAAGGAEGTASVAVALTPVGSVEVAPAALSLPAGESRALAATVRDERGSELSGRVVSWTSSDPAIARVDAGQVTAVAAGTAVISASSGGKTGTSTVTVPAPAVAAVASVDVTPSSAAVAVGGSVQLQAIARDAQGNALSGRAISWSSSNPGVAAVDASGRASGVSAGQATITATVEGKSGTAGVAVTAAGPAPVASVEVTPSSANLVTGGSAQLQATLRDASGTVLTGRSVSWSSSNPAAATVDGTGKVQAVAPGSATITATSEGKSGTASIAVTAPAPVPVASVEVSPATASVPAGQTAQLTAAPKDAQGNNLSGRAVSWSTSVPGVATVDGNGLVTGVAPGSATITATSEGKSGSAQVTVTPAPVASVEVSPASQTVQAGQSASFTATLRDSKGNALTGRTVTWTSSNPAVATVDGNGTARGLLPGTTTITATAEGVSGSATLTVTVGPPANLIKVSGDGQEGTAGQALPAPLVVRVTDILGNPVPNVTVSWSVTVGNGSVSPTTSVTDARGEASTVWTLGAGPKEQAVQASAAGLTPVVFSGKR